MGQPSRLRTAAKWIFRLAASAVVLVLVAAGAVYAVTASRMAADFEVPAHAIAVSMDSATLARGKHLASIKGCVECHGAGLGGNIVLDEPAIGRMSGPNLTLGGRGRQLSDEDWERAVRHGVRRDGKPLLYMPAQEFTTLSDEDLAAIVAYARTLEPVSKVMPPSKAGPLIRVLHIAGQVQLPAEEIEHKNGHMATIAAEPTVTYGKYLAAGCTGCHGNGFSGGPIPGTPPEWKPAANLTPAGIGHYTQADFTRVLRTGMRPSGVPVDSTMPWKLTKEMTDTEVAALYAYLRTVPSKPFGQR